MNIAGEIMGESYKDKAEHIITMIFSILLISIFGLLFCFYFMLSIGADIVRGLLNDRRKM